MPDELPSIPPHKQADPQGVPAWLVWILAAVGLLLLLQQLQGSLLLFMRSPINPDIAGFMSDARQMQAFYDCPTREPFQVLWFKAGLLFSQDTELVARVTTLLQTVLAGLLVLLFGRRFFGDIAGLTALYLFAVNPIVHYYGVSGMRAPLFCALLLLFGLCLFDVWRPRRRTLQSVLAGIAGGLLILTRAYSYVIVAGAFAVWFLTNRGWRPEFRRQAARHLLIAALVVAALVVPDLLLRPPSPIHGQTVNFWRNLEFHGDPGTWQSDPPVSHFRYLFLEHSPAHVVLRVAGNYARYAFQYLPHFMRGYEWLWWLFPVGLVASFFTRKEFAVALWIFSLAHVVFIMNLNQVPGSSGIENRYVFQAYPLALLLVIHGLLFLIDRLSRLIPARFAKMDSVRRRLQPILFSATSPPAH
ncbi:MAG: glycosyltransferase family 39 protein [Acidobacteriota bacterium]